MLTLILYVLRAVAKALVEPMSLLVLILIGAMFYKQNKKITLMQKIVVGKSINSPLELTISQIVIGIFGAVLASLIIACLGITFREDSLIDFIFILSIIFMFIKPRFVCFAYSGAALGLLSFIFEKISIILNKPSLDLFKIDIVALMSLVAVLHFVEGIMIILDGKRGAIPVFKNDKGTIFGGFLLKRYWILPVALLFIMNPNSFEGISINFPNWWPIVKQNIPFNTIKNLIISAITFYGILGYESVTFTRSKEEKTVSSGIWVILYSIVLFLFSQVSSNNEFAQLLLIIFAPLGHEAMILIQRFMEIKGKAIYASGEEGIMVLEVIPNSLADEMGIKSGDLLMNINNNKINEENDILDVLRDAPNYIKLTARKISGELKELKYDNLVSKNDLGALMVPKVVPEDNAVIKLKGKEFKKYLDEAKKREEDNQ
ncbi:PDZ domain-containing protein [Haloimpatiens lingqiaonensis]|uniref:PDZ domain-containing protein n=1 Tax=Haloimpatiens lingqiaonensis TaxID=1380675 RepID=UPI0010FD70BC|nr:PDZ domain-containing protein [Haloimpatiens lingqiaonensis]